MAAVGATTESATIPVGSHDTALCIIPPRQLWPSLNSLRSLYDKSYERWPPHVNLVYPFVKAEALPQAVAQIADRLRSRNTSVNSQTLPISLDTADVFVHRHDNTIFIHDSIKEHRGKLSDARDAILTALGHEPNSASYRMHLTIGQTEDANSDLHKFLLRKAALIPTVEWEAAELCILIREKTQRDGNISSEMKLWGTVSLGDFSVVQCPEASSFAGSGLSSDEAVAESGSLGRIPYSFSTTTQKWEPYQASLETEERTKLPEYLRVANYNVLAEFEFPPSQSRYPILIKNMLDRPALSDILVLEEVTDNFLSYLLKDNGIKENYSFTTYGPPDQHDIDPLPSHLNVVVLSKWAFKWDWISFKRKHKGSVVLQFRDIGRTEDGIFVPLVLATVHLTCGMTDGSVAAKKGELQAVLKYLLQENPQNPWLLAGDFNITTSAFTIDAALKKKAISSQTAKYLSQMEVALTESGLSDAWTEARLDNLDMSARRGPNDSQGAFEGETGATFDPTVNELASEIVGSGFNNRPQRYDRILFKGHGIFSIAGFNMFGQEPGDLEIDSGAGVQARKSYGSDHWGIRCILKMNQEEPTDSSNATTKPVVPVELKPASPGLANISDLKEILDKRQVLPSEDDISKREIAFNHLRAILLDSDNEESATKSRAQLTLVLVPVGSYGLGVWTASSDIDCLCIGSISSKTFFALATQRLRRASSNDVRILRRVSANSGTMLELDIKGVKMDLQYCPSTWIAETWPQAMRLHPGDAAFSLSMQTLAKLKPVRDLYYLRQTIPDLATFRTAHYVVKTWARQRGIYAGKFGYLNGIQISVLLSRVCKMLSHEGSSASVPTILTTFFNHYANFDWTTNMVFDPFFHKRLRYVRTAREPMVVLGFHPPSLNTALAASTPAVRTIAEEFRKADEILCHDDATWSEFLGDHERADGALGFLRTYKSYVKIDVQFWGVSLAKGSQYVGWLESRCVMLLVDLSRRTPNIHARMWPARFVSAESSDDETDYQGCYLIGLDQLETSGGAATLSKEDLKIALGGLQTALQNFEGRIRGDEKFFDVKTSWMSASVVKQSDLGKLKLDHREWGAYTIGDDESEEEEEVTEEEDDDEEDGDAEGGRPKAKSKKTTARNDIPTRPAYEGKFRSSADVISRLRWDPSLDSSDYVVGYEDRFLGAMERALDLWKSEQTDEEFIPQHRVLYFKRKSDGVVVWDRKARKDMLFGSGVKDIEV